MDILNPATGKIEMTREEHTPAQIKEMFVKAKTGQKAWRARPYQERADIIKKFSDLVGQRLDECGRALTLDMGKPLAHAIGEVKGTLGRIAFFLQTTPERLAAKEVYNEGSMNEVIGFEPLGVIANISAWNYPWFVGGNVFIPALLTGNAVLYKPSEFAVRTGEMIHKLLMEAGVPADVFQCIIGGGAAGQALLEQPVNGVFFTGSYATGKKISESLAGRMIRVQMELGGKDPVYVRADADPVAAAQSVADGAFFNAGQGCCAVERVYVHASIEKPFIEEFVKFAKEAKVGDPLAEGTYMGPLTRKPQLAVIEDQLAEAKAKGAQILVGGARVPGDGFYFQPTVVTNVDHSMKLMTEESFGPVIGIMSVKDDNEAVRYMNDTTYGLTAGIYTKDKKAAEELMEDVNVGTVYWNCCDRVSPRLPWSGRGWSGVGSTLSYIGVDAFLQPKAWHKRTVS